MSERPFIEMRPQTICCPAHGEHLRDQWPKGYATVGLTLFTAALENEKLIHEVDPSWDGQDGHGHLDEDALNRIFALRPMCYWVDRATIRRALMNSEIGQLVKCEVCKRTGLGGPYQASYPQGIVTLTLCFECGLDAGERLHEAYPNGKVWPRL